jgi:hypothetical protein
MCGNFPWQNTTEDERNQKKGKEKVINEIPVTG